MTPRPISTHFRAGALLLGLAAGAAVAVPAPLPGQEPGAETARGRVDSRGVSVEFARLGEQPEDKSARIASETRAVQEQLARQVARRDALLARLESEPSRTLPGRLLDAWERRRTRAQLEAIVTELQREQAQLLALRAEGRRLDDQAAERDWEHLQELVDSAARASLDGRAEAPELEPAIAEALDRAGGRSPARTLERYRLLVGRLARVNTLLGEGHPAVALAHPEVSDGVANQDASRTAPETSGFLGVSERGLPVTRTEADASQEAWKRLRRTLADEIVSTATEITLRVRSSS
jgi:hypothetical protein